MNEDFYPPSQAEIVEVLRQHPLIKLKGPVTRAFLVGSFAKRMTIRMADEDPTHQHSDVDVLLEIPPRKGLTSAEVEEHHRQALSQYFLKHNIRGPMDSLHPQWLGRRVDLYFTYDADQERRPMFLLSPGTPSESPSRGVRRQRETG